MLLAVLDEDPSAFTDKLQKSAYPGIEVVHLPDFYRDAAERSLSRDYGYINEQDLHRFRAALSDTFGDAIAFGNVRTRLRVLMHRGATVLLTGVQERDREQVVGLGGYMLHVVRPVPANGMSSFRALGEDGRDFEIVDGGEAATLNGAFRLLSRSLQ